MISLWQALWRLREEITAGLLDDGYCYKYDISLPLDDYYRVVEVMRQRLREVTTRVVAYGHVGDGLSRILPFCVQKRPMIAVSGAFVYPKPWIHSVSISSVQLNSAHGGVC